jgi:hypothetical protein
MCAAAMLSQCIAWLVEESTRWSLLQVVKDCYFNQIEFLWSLDQSFWFCVYIFIGDGWRATHLCRLACALSSFFASLPRQLAIGKHQELIENFHGRHNKLPSVVWEHEVVEGQYAQWCYKVTNKVCRKNGIYSQMEDHVHLENKFIVGERYD